MTLHALHVNLITFTTKQTKNKKMQGKVGSVMCPVHVYMSFPDKAA